MSDGTKIEWTDATWNVVNGCSVVSPGCTNCYAMKQAHRFEQRRGLTMHTKGGMVWTGEVRFNEKVLLDPIRWKRPRKIFVCAHGDLFHEKVPDEWIDRVFAVMALAPQHTFQVLTKRPERMREYLLADRRDEMNSYAGTMMHWDKMPSADWPLPNVWLGVSAEDQARADERIPLLLVTPAAVRWLSCEPLLGPVDLDQAWHGESALDSECWGDCNWCRNGADFPPLHNCQANQQSEADWAKGRSGVDWVVAGGESGPGARPMHPDWARSLRDQCAAAGVAFLFKQWGDWFPYGHVDADGHQNSRDRAEDPRYWSTWNDASGELGSVLIGKKQAGRFLDGQLHDGFPA